MKKVQLYFLLFFLNGFFTTFLAGIPEDEEQYKRYKQSILELHLRNKEQAVLKSKQWFDLAQKQKKWDRMADAYNMLGIIYGSYREFDSSNRYYLQALKLSQEHQLQEIQFKIDLNLGMNYFYQARYDKALTHYHHSLRYFEEKGDEMGIANASSNIGFCHAERGENDLALRYLQRANKIYEKLQMLPFAARTLNGIGLSYLNQHKIDTAIGTFKKAISFLGNDISAVKNSSLVNLGKAYFKKKEYEQAKIYCQLAYENSLQIDDQVDQTAALIILGKIYLADGDYSKAIQNLETALPLVKANNKLMDENMIYDQLSILYKKQKNYEKALFYIEKYLQTNQQIFNSESEKTIRSLEASYENDKKRKLLKIKNLELSLLKVSNQKRWYVLISLASSALLIIAALILVIFRTRSKGKRREELLRSKLLNSFDELQELRTRLEANVEAGNEQTVSPLDGQKINQCLIEPLSERELEILYQLKLGKTNKEIASSSFISENTVKFHLKNIFIKLNVLNRKDALNKAITLTKQ